MATTKLTARAVAGLTTDQTQEEFPDGLVPGLGLRVGRGGAKTWVLRYRVAGAQRRMTLGRYPRLSLADARQRARGILAEADAGRDPAAEKIARRSDDVTFGALAAEVLEAKASKTRRATMREYQRIVDVELLPHWKDRPAASITRRDVVTLVEKIEGRGSPVMANRVLATIKVLFNKALERQFATLEENPAHRLKLSDEGGRDRYLDRDEIRAVWKATEWEAPVMGAIFRLAMLSAQRIGNVCALRWADIDDADVWTIPASAFKGRRAHMVPLSVEAVAVLGEIRALTGDHDYAFPGRSGAKTPHVSQHANALRRLRAHTDIPEWTAHDFRRTFRTWATFAAKPEDPRDPAGLGVAPYIADAVLGHKEASLGFERYQGEVTRYLLAEKRDALSRWGAFVAEVIA